MKTPALITLAAAALLTGCAATAPAPGTPSARAQGTDTAAASTRQAVPVPAASARKLVLQLTGPRTVTESRDWPAFKEEWRATFAEHAKEAGVAFAFHEGPARPAPESGTLLSVQVDDFRMVGIGSRMFFGAMTGNAYVNARASYSDLRSGRPFGAQNFNTSSSAWHGVFGRMTPQQVDAIASEVFTELKAAK